jgi:hypothetical protein
MTTKEHKMMARNVVLTNVMKDRLFLKMANAKIVKTISYLIQKLLVNNSIANQEKGSKRMDNVRCVLDNYVIQKIDPENLFKMIRKSKTRLSECEACHGKKLIRTVGLFDVDLKILFA